MGENHQSYDSMTGSSGLDILPKSRSFDLAIQHLQTAPEMLLGPLAKGTTVTRAGARTDVASVCTGHASSSSAVAVTSPALTNVNATRADAAKGVVHILLRHEQHPALSGIGTGIGTGIGVRGKIGVQPALDERTPGDGIGAKSPFHLNDESPLPGITGLLEEKPDYDAIISMALESPG